MNHFTECLCTSLLKILLKILIPFIFDTWYDVVFIYTELVFQIGHLRIFSISYYMWQEAFYIYIKIIGNLNEMHTSCKYCTKVLVPSYLDYLETFILSFMTVLWCVFVFYTLYSFYSLLCIVILWWIKTGCAVTLSQFVELCSFFPFFLKIGFVRQCFHMI